MASSAPQEEINNNPINPNPIPDVDNERPIANIEPQSEVAQSAKDSPIESQSQESDNEGIRLPAEVSAPQSMAAAVEDADPDDEVEEIIREDDINNELIFSEHEAREQKGAIEIEAAVEGSLPSAPRQAMSSWEADGDEDGQLVVSPYTAEKREEMALILQKIAPSVSMDLIIQFADGIGSMHTTSSQSIGDYIAEKQRMDNDKLHMEYRNIKEMFQNAIVKYDPEAIDKLVHETSQLAAQALVEAKWRILDEKVRDIDQWHFYWQNRHISQVRWEESIKEFFNRIDRAAAQIESDHQVSMQQRATLAKEIRALPYEVAAEKLRDSALVRGMQQQIDDVKEDHESDRLCWDAKRHLLETQLEMAESEVSQLNGKVANMEEKMSKMQSTIDDLTAQWSQMNGKLNLICRTQNQQANTIAEHHQRSRAEHDVNSAILYKHEHVMRGSNMLQPLQADGTSRPVAALNPNLDQSRLGRAVEDTTHTAGWAPRPQ